MRFRDIATAALVGVLLGCADAGLEDLKSFVELDLPPLLSDEPVDADVTRSGWCESMVPRRNPFESAHSTGTLVAPSEEPDPGRPRQPLERFPLAGLSMVGTLSGRGGTFALVRDPDGVTHAVAAGDYLGRDHGRITAVHEREIRLDELVAEGAGFRRRSRSIALVEFGSRGTDSGDTDVD